MTGSGVEVGVASAAPASKIHLPVPVWVGVVEWVVIVGLVVMAAWLGYRRWRRRHRPKVSDRERSLRRWVIWVSSRWTWDAVNLGLVLVDDTTRHRREWWSGRTLPPLVRIPQIRFEIASGGLRALMCTLPGVGLDQVTKQAEHLANAWGCLRVDVTQDTPGWLMLRGHLSDPLAQPWTVTPDGRPLVDWQLHVGVDEDAGPVLLPLANLSGITVAGVPGTGKTSLQRWWLCQLIPHPAVQVAVLDGKVSDCEDGDYGLLLGRCFAAAGDDLGDANQLLGRLHSLMRARSAWLRANRGTAQFWEHGPTHDCPLIVVVVDESHTYVTGVSRKDRDLCDSNVWYLTKLAKEGRSRGFVTVFVTQKQTADAIPTAIRDVCQVGLSFGVRTMDGAVAALGDDIRQYPDIAPTQLIGRQWTGVAVMRLPDRAGYHRVRTPYCAEADAARVAHHYALLRQTPAAPQTFEAEVSA
jgi:S-DNA-T family DNA segregation ATPase FtsK/SpoIIIE